MSRIGRRTRKQSQIKPEERPKAQPAPTGSSPTDQVLMLQRTVGNRAVESMVRKDEAAKQPTPSDSGRVAEKSPDRGEQIRRDGVLENNPAGTGGAVVPQGAQEKGPKKKKAGVKSFDVDWSENSASDATHAQLRLDYKAKFKKDDEHDPALAEFRQNVMTKWEITDGPRKGDKGDTSPMHDDNYSRADDLDGNTINDTDFYSNDNPGFDGTVHKDDDLNYSFTAEQMIIDTSQGNKVLEKKGPATGTIKGKHPRKFSIPGRC